MIHITVNGQATSVLPGSTISSLLIQLEIPMERVAVELDRTIIRPPLWEVTELRAGAQVEIVHFVGGG
jgi:thiamine biosynthesis protein ThiS